VVGTPISSLARRLGIEPGGRVGLIRAPEGFARVLEPLPSDVRVRTQARATLDVAVFFATRRSELDRRFETLARAVGTDGALWIAWPKRTACVATDLREAVVREIGTAHGLVDEKLGSLDEHWSAVRFVHPAAAGFASRAS
jgi:hypothetical protein